MSIKTMEKSVDIISRLPDTPMSPEFSAQRLKEKFDEGANLIKDYINDSLIPDVTNEISRALTAEGSAAYVPVKKLFASFTSPGTYTFSTADHSSVNGLYDVVVIAGGGGGYLGDISTGGGGGDAVRKDNISLTGAYTVNVGAGGQAGDGGGMSYITGEGLSCHAFGGSATSQYVKLGLGGGINGTESIYGDGSVWYGKGGDCVGYGKGAVGGAVRDDIKNPVGYGGGGWGSVPGGGGAVFIYGYEAVNS